MSDTANTTTVRISSTLLNGSTPLRINGRNCDVPHNKDVVLDASAFAALSDSTVRFEVVAAGTDAAAPAGEGSGEPSPAVSSAFDPAAVLAKKVTDILQDMDEFSAEQIEALIAAENAKGETARITLVTPLTEKLEALKAPPTE